MKSSTVAMFFILSFAEAATLERRSLLAEVCEMVNPQKFKSKGMLTTFCEVFKDVIPGSGLIPCETKYYCGLYGSEAGRKRLPRNEDKPFNDVDGCLRHYGHRKPRTSLL